MEDCRLTMLKIVKTERGDYMYRVHNLLASTLSLSARYCNTLECACRELVYQIDSSVHLVAMLHKMRFVNWPRPAMFLDVCSWPAFHGVTDRKLDVPDLGLS